MVNTGYHIDFDFNPRELEERLATFDHKVNRFVEETLVEVAARSEASMKAEAPWMDRTGNARRGLYAVPYNRPKFGIRFGHSVEYGIWLEIANRGKYQIIMPTVLKAGRALMRSLEYMLPQLDMPVPIAPLVMPGSGMRHGTSQGVTREAGRLERRTKRILKRAVHRVGGMFRRHRNV